MKRRLNLAAALLHAPPLLLRDEPTAGVDPQSRNKLCDRVGIIDRGRLLALGTVAELTQKHGGKSVVTLHKGDDTHERIETDDPVREIQRVLSNGHVQNVRIDRPDLESVFLGLTGRSLRD